MKSIEFCRQQLGQTGLKMSDAEIEKLRDALQICAKVFIQSYLKPHDCCLHLGKGKKL